MKLRALRLHGFKSFADRTEIAFHDGITAIVGPNGCGKSNISDAVRWVLGEQRPTAIRGARMEEAIFQGTVNRRPVNRGAVAMELSNQDGLLPVPFEEVEIARTVYRDGGSEYQLNRSACRLKDIQELCRDTGLGANAYSIIEGRMIDAILSDRAEERRGLFEEAAGIGKYKDRRRAASRRLERAEVDLQRLEDLIGEVETKVRSLARQKGKAERYRSLRKRRLDVEVTVVRTRVATLEARQEELGRLLEGGLDRDESLQAEIQTLEARLETLRIERIEAERARTGAAGQLEQVRSELIRWERELAVAEERASHADRRLGRIGEERDEARSRATRSEQESTELRTRLAALRVEREALDERLRTQAEAGAQVRDRLAEARKALEEAEGEERDAARRAAQLQGDRESAAAQARELESRLVHLAEELDELRQMLEEVTSQGDLFAGEAEALSEAEDGARTAVEALGREVEEVRSRLDDARKLDRGLQDRAEALEARVSALDRMDRDREGVEPVIQAVLENFPQVAPGVLADFLEGEPAVIRGVELYLGALTRAVVVRDGDAAAKVIRWFRDEWEGGGGLVLLPLDRVPSPRKKGGLLNELRCRGEGAPWVEALLGGVEAEAGDPGGADFGERIGADGSWTESGGVLRVGNPLGATGLLERRAELERLRAEAEEVRAEAHRARKDRDDLQEALRELEEALDEARKRFREAEDARREARAQEAARSDRRARVARQVEELERQIDMTRTARERASERGASAADASEALGAREEELREARSKAREVMDRVQEEWDQARERESAITVEMSRLTGDMSRLDERLQDLETAGEAANRRVESLDMEEQELRADLERTAELRTEGARETEALFGRREEAEKLLRERDEALSGMDEALALAERQARDARSAEREASQSRHRLELEAQEVEGRLGRIQDRLEGEWGRSWVELVADADEVEGSEEELETELREIVGSLERIGPVNMLAVEEHEEESARLDFLTEQRDDLVKARDDLRSAIREINQTATRLFSETFEAIKENFRKTFLHLFEGGEADLWLTDPDDPLESDVEIHASPRGKRTQRIHLLSGGERALTALALLFGIYLVKPSPFCILDEVDAPLDESNIGRFVRLLEDFKEQTQFVVITHNPRTIESADWIYGVTMEEPGVSTVVGVRLEEALEAAGV
jgi:chromosome segregation protein